MFKATTATITKEGKQQTKLYEAESCRLLGEEQMTQDEIIRMAREAGFVVTEVNGFLELKLCHPTPRAKSLGKMFERFAALVAAHEREKWEQALPIAMDAMMLQEREACAKVCDELKWHSPPKNFAENCAAAIRARGEK